MPGDLYHTPDEASVMRVHAAHQAMRVDYGGGTNAIYVGWALPGSATSSPVWRIQCNTYDANNNLLSTVWANGAALYVNVWDNRASLPYS